GTSTTRPTSFTNPATAGNVAFANPTNAYDGSLTTGSTGTAIAASNTNATVTQTVSCKWQGWAQPAGVVDAVTLNVIASMDVSASSEGPGAASANATLYYSFDAGISLHTLKTIYALGNT